LKNGSALSCHVEKRIAESAKWSAVLNFINLHVECYFTQKIVQKWLFSQWWVCFRWWRGLQQKLEQMKLSEGKHSPCCSSRRSIEDNCFSCLPT
jgi:hypothetical protein